MFHFLPYPYLWYSAALALMGAEMFLLGRSSSPRFSWAESWASLGVAIGHRFTNYFATGVTLAIYYWAWELRPWTIPLNNCWAIGGLFGGLEFCYYWYHRAAHQYRWLWATHSVHHSSRYFNLSAAYRLGWTGLLSGNFLFFLPLCWLGFHPLAVMTGLGLNLLYQFWIHTELIPKLGPLEWIFNTPSHHRVHHAANPEYVDRNYGGVLILCDRLFGTFTAERPQLRPRYGLTDQWYSTNPVAIACHEWHRMWTDWRDCSHD